MNSVTLEQYLRAAYERNQATTHTLVVTTLDDGGVKFYVHPSGLDGETPTFNAKGDRVALPGVESEPLFEEVIDTSIPNDVELVEKTVDEILAETESAPAVTEQVAEAPVVDAVAADEHQESAPASPDA